VVFVATIWFKGALDLEASFEATTLSNTSFDQELRGPIMITSVSNVIKYVLRDRKPSPKSEFKYSRTEYKKQWNSVSRSIDDAKMAVSGYVDEDLYAQTGRGTVEMLQQFVGVSRDDVFLEIGAGVGRVGAALAPLCRHWIGADVSENMVKHMKHRLAALPNVSAIAVNGFDLSNVQSESIDVVYCTVVFMHLEEWDRYNYILEAFRVLKPGGRLLVDNVNLLSDDGWKFFEEHRALPPTERPSQISKTSTPQELETYFRRAGYDAIKQEFSGLWVFTYGTKPAGQPA
jgi:ubiquinone/menaquinone biosynthesis C-methylase UbiE